MKKTLFAVLTLFVLFWGSPAFAQVTRQDLVTLSKAQASLKAKRYPAAIKTLTALLKQVPNLTDGHRLLGHAYYDSGQLVKARSSFMTAFKQGCLESDVLGRLAKMDQDEKRFPSLVNLLRLLMITNPMDQSWRILYADVLLVMGELDEAEALFKQLIEAQPTRKDFYLRLGNLALRRGRLKDAATAYETAYHLGELGPKLPGTIAGLWYDLERWRDALAWYERAIVVEPKKAEAYQLRRGRLLVRIDELAQGQRVLKSLSASKDKEKARSALLLLGQIAQRQGKTDVAVGHWIKAFEAGHRDGKLLKFLGLHYFKARDYKSARRYLSLIEAGSDDAVVLRALIAATLRSGDETEARSQLKRYLGLFGLDKSARALIRELARVGSSTKKPG
ncbi:MAG: tetratricopeptide repeat protein [Planctomycetota bacterium]|nr:tetratricopeptide repeat protein [Planctomycetota bacterium]